MGEGKAADESGVLRDCGGRVKRAMELVHRYPLEEASATSLGSAFGRDDGHVRSGKPGNGGTVQGVFGDIEDCKNSNIVCPLIR